MPKGSSAARVSAGGLSLRVDVVLLTPGDGTLNVLLLGPASVGSRERWALPTGVLRTGESVDDSALRIAREVIGAAPSHLEQAGALGGARRSATDAVVTLAYVALVPVGTAAKGGASWVALAEAGTLAIRQRDEIERSVATIRDRLDHQPVAFQLLPNLFTLSELQAVYEMLLGRPVHKASFRRSLHAAAIVEATDEWRSEGRGRPAQLFRYAPPRRRRQRRSVRFDLIG